MVLICLHGKINENHWTSAINWGQFPTMFDYRRGTSHGAPAIDAVLWQPRPRNTKSIGICIFKVTYDPLTEFHMLFFFAGFLYICFFVQKNVCFIWYDPVSSSELSFLQHVRRFAPSFTPFFQRQNGHGGSGLGPEQRGTVPPSTGHGAHEKMPGLDWFEHWQKSSIYDGKIHDCPIDVQLFNQKNNCWFD